MIETLLTSHRTAITAIVAAYRERTSSSAIKGYRTSECELQYVASYVIAPWFRSNNRIC